MAIELTPAQARTLAGLAAREGRIVLHQLTHDDPAFAADDVYATPHGTAVGYRIARDGRLSTIGTTLPA
jgi:hypothetical protein